MSATQPPIGDPSASVFRLLARAPDVDSTAGRTIELAGIRWSLREYGGIPGSVEVPPYTCISYSWGRSRTANPFNSGQMISARALAVAEATIEVLQPAAIWLDAICVPLEDPAREECLQGMGAIYAAATQVAVVLSKACTASLDQIRTSGRLDPADLPVFENDEWVSRAWTYQEIANSRVTQFISEDGGGAVDGQQLLNSLGQAISDLKKTGGFAAFEFQQRFPSVNDLEDTLADYMISSYLQRFAYQVMAAMDRRDSERPVDHFNAMIGALSATPSNFAGDRQLPPAERFMRVCETKGDYSFIYCAARRSAVPGRGWRPAADEIPALLSWHTFGDGQSGDLFPTHLQLHNMCRMNPGALNADATKLLRWWLESGGISAPPADLAGGVLERLRKIGFSGCGEHLEMEAGYFFPQGTLADVSEPHVVVPAGVRWAHGGPGLVVTGSGANLHHFRDVGVFVGRVPQSGAALGVA